MGHLKNGQWVGPVKETTDEGRSCFIGSLQDGLRTGIGRLVNDGGSIIGTWEGDKTKNGFTIVVSQDVLFSGWIDAGQKNGLGVYSNLASKVAVEGCFKLDQIDGYAHVRQGSRYFLGCFVLGKKQGPGVQVLSDNKVFFGSWHQDSREGPGILVKGCHLLSGYWKSDAPSGLFYLTSRDKPQVEKTFRYFRGRFVECQEDTSSYSLPFDPQKLFHDLRSKMQSMRETVRAEELAHLAEVSRLEHHLEECKLKLNEQIQKFEDRLASLAVVHSKQMDSFYRIRGLAKPIKLDSYFEKKFALTIKTDVQVVHQIPQPLVHRKSEKLRKPLSNSDQRTTDSYSMLLYHEEFPDISDDSPIFVDVHLDYEAVCDASQANLIFGQRAKHDSDKLVTKDERTSTDLKNRDGRSRDMLDATENTGAKHQQSKPPKKKQQVCLAEMLEEKLISSHRQSQDIKRAHQHLPLTTTQKKSGVSMLLDFIYEGKEPTSDTKQSTDRTPASPQPHAKPPAADSQQLKQKEANQRISDQSTMKRPANSTAQHKQPSKSLKWTDSQTATTQLTDTKASHPQASILPHDKNSSKPPKQPTPSSSASEKHHQPQLQQKIPIVACVRDINLSHVASLIDIKMMSVPEHVDTAPPTQISFVYPQRLVKSLTKQETLKDRQTDNRIPLELKATLIDFVASQLIIGGLELEESKGQSSDPKINCIDLTSDKLNQLEPQQYSESAATGGLSIPDDSYLQSSNRFSDPPHDSHVVEVEPSTAHDCASEQPQRQPSQRSLEPTAFTEPSPPPDPSHVHTIEEHQRPTGQIERKEEQRASNTSDHHQSRTDKQEQPMNHLTNHNTSSKPAPIEANQQQISTSIQSTTNKIEPPLHFSIHHSPQRTTTADKDDFTRLEANENDADHSPQQSVDAVIKRHATADDLLNDHDRQAERTAISQPPDVRNLHHLTYPSHDDQAVFPVDAVETSDDPPTTFDKPSDGQQTADKAHEMQQTHIAADERNERPSDQDRLILDQDMDGEIFELDLPEGIERRPDDEQPVSPFVDPSLRTEQDMERNAPYNEEDISISQPQLQDSLAPDEVTTDPQAINVDCPDNRSLIAKEASVSRADGWEDLHALETQSEQQQEVDKSVEGFTDATEGLLPADEEMDDLDFLIEDDPDDPNKLMQERSAHQSRATSRQATFIRRPPPTDQPTQPQTAIDSKPQTE